MKLFVVLKVIALIVSNEKSNAQSNRFREKKSQKIDLVKYYICKVDCVALNYLSISVLFPVRLATPTNTTIVCFSHITPSIPLQRVIYYFAISFC